MGLKLVYEALEIEKLLDQEKAAKDKGPIAEQTFQDKAVEEAVEKKKEQSDDSVSSMDTTSEGSQSSSEEDTSDIDPETDEGSSKKGEEVDPTPKETSDDKEDTKEKEESTKEDKSEEDEKPVQESLRELGESDIALESFGELLGSVGGAVTTAAGVITNALMRSVAAIATLISIHGKDILKGMYKGVIYTLANLINGIGKTYSAIDKAIERRQNSISSLKKQLDTLKTLITSIETREKPIEDLKITYGNKAVINALKSGDSTDVVKNLLVLDKFLVSTIGNLHRAILDDVASIQYLTTLFTHGRNINHVDLLRLKSPGVGLATGSLVGYDPVSEYVQPYKSRDPLPGDIVVVAELPKESLTTLEGYEQAYKDSKLYLGFNKANYHQVNDIEVVGFNQVKSVVSTLEKLIFTLEKQQTLYEDIRRTKPGVILSIKRHAMNLVESNTKVRYSDSLVGPMYLKSTFIAKVYLAGSLDIHDYAAKTISNGLSFAQELAKKYS